ncbi:MAG: GNAT family N-acetyltransferase [Candidatus Binatia bacterium]
MTSSKQANVHIRRARRDDFESLAALTGWPDVAGSERRTIRLFRNILADQAYDLYVAEDAGETIGVGAVSYVRVLGLGGQRATLEDVTVRPDRRRRGVGRALVEFLRLRGSRRGARSFEAAASDAAAESFLRAVGFERAGDRFHRELGA